MGNMKCLKYDQCKGANSSCTRLGPEHSCSYFEQIEAPKKPTPLGQVDSVVKCKIAEEDFCMVCPECGHHPLTLMGERKGLDMKLTDGKAQCPVCPYEMAL